MCAAVCFFFFFQAEDGIRDLTVTGVQTCALPIYPSPVFVARNVGVSGYPKIVGDNHLKLQLAQNGVQLTAIGFRMAHRLNEIDVSRTNIDVAFQLQLERYNGEEYLQAKLLDLRPAT